jgi:hypothetical protein
MSVGIGSAAELVADVLRRDRRFDAERAKAIRHLRLEDLAQVHLVDAEVPVRVVLDVADARKVFGRDAEHQPLGDDRHAVAAPLAQPLDDGAGQRVHDCLEPHGRLELLADHRQRRAGRLADAERQMARLAPQSDDEIPAGSRLRVDHQVLEDIDAVMAGRQ